MNAAAAGGCRRSRRHRKETERRSGGESGVETRPGPPQLATVSGTTATPSPRVSTARIIDRSFVSNATLFAGRVREQLSSLSREKVKFQVSIDGARPETNDPIRGAGTFVKALDGARVLSDLGFDVSLTTVTT